MRINEAAKWISIRPYIEYGNIRYGVGRLLLSPKGLCVNRYDGILYTRLKRKGRYKGIGVNIRNQRKDNKTIVSS